MFTVLIAEPQGEIQSRLKSFFAARGDEVVDTAEDGMEAYVKIQIRKPDLVLLDVSLTRIDNIALARWIKAWSPATRVVFVTPHEGETFSHFVNLLSIEGYACFSTLEEDLSALMTLFTRENVLYGANTISYNYTWGEAL